MNDVSPRRCILNSLIVATLWLIHLSGLGFWLLLFALWFFHAYPVGHFSIDVRTQWGGSTAHATEAAAEPEPR